MASNNVSVRSTYFQDQYSDNRMARDLLKGLKGTRGFLEPKGNSSVSESIYLPKFPKEPNEFYYLRLMRSQLSNYWLRTIKSDSGKILANGVYIKSDGVDISENYEELTENIDMEGQTIETLANDQLIAGSAKGVSLVVVDHNGARPYTRQVDIDDVLDFSIDRATGNLTYLKFELDVDDDTNKDNGIVRVKGTYEMWPDAWLITDESGEVLKEGEILRYKDGSTRITDAIPVSVFYTGKTGVLLAQSPYQTLAELTIEYFQEYSNFKNLMFYAMTPMLFGFNMPADFKMNALASYSFTSLPEQGESTPDVRWIQVDAAPIEQGRMMLQDIERRISTFGLDVQETRTGNATATEKAIESSGSNATISTNAQALAQHLERILHLMESYEVTPDNDFEVSITPDFSLTGNSQEIDQLIKLREMGAISHIAFIDSLIERKLLPIGFDYEADAEIIIEEAQKQLELQKELNPEQSQEEITPNTNNSNENNNDNLE